MTTNDDPAPDPDDLAERIEFKAAVFEHGDGSSRALAQDKAARLYGFASWADWERRGAPKTEAAP